MNLARCCLFVIVLSMMSLSVVAQEPDEVPIPPPEIALPPEIEPPPPGIAIPPGEAPPLVPIIPPPAEKPPPKIWLGEVELGLSGSEGNSQNAKFRIGGKVKRETPHHRFTLDALYRYARANNTVAEDRLFVTDKAEWLFPGNPFSVYLSGTTEYDKFKAFDVRIARQLGVSYDLIKNDTTTLMPRFGGGASKEIGGPNNRWVPELQFGADFEHKLNELQKLIVTFDYFPDVSDFGDYRFQGKVSYEIVIHPELGLTLRLGILDLFDSTPEKGRKKNDLDYFATLLWKF